MSRIEIFKAKLNQIPVRYKSWNKLLNRYVSRVVYIQQFSNDKTPETSEDWVLISPIPNSTLFSEFVYSSDLQN